ncbi:acyltransferase [Cellvibrio sp. KY-GH-1]|uniref:acyltransferase family protein n=1 Tax=Cellvibrio sp. KY-GH-1 TaxID=2303332 RepID=UPI001247F48C|nr:acyltransferase [Cellvibrio sp. KY-GH-1]QEY17328.1 acyltransferase [Cellvibrio sp. KY-GH-1]
MNSQVNQSIDYLMVLRALSAIAVVFCHMPFTASSFLGIPENEWLNGFFNPFGYIPVLLFFTLSGYLVTLGFVSGRHNAYSVKGIVRYYHSRIFRIIPLYYFSILICVLVFWSAAEDNLLRVINLLWFVENYKPVNGIVFNHVYWTMPIEMLYFFLAPFVYLAARWLTERTGDIVCLLLIFFIGLVISHLVFAGFEKSGEGVLATRKDWNLLARFNFIYNLPAFLLGGVCAFIACNPKNQTCFLRYRTLIKFSSLLAFLVVTIYCSTIGLQQMGNGLINYFIVFGLIPALALIVFAVAVLGLTQPTKAGAYVACMRGMEHLGLLSYGIYLFHMPVYEVINKTLKVLNVGISGEWITILVLIFTVIFSQVTYLLIEQPFLRRRHIT